MGTEKEQKQTAICRLKHTNNYVQCKWRDRVNEKAEIVTQDKKTKLYTV